MISHDALIIQPFCLLIGQWFVTLATDYFNHDQLEFPLQTGGSTKRHKIWFVKDGCYERTMEMALKVKQLE